jgi:SNF2 family DNA or RNA helicase
LGHRILTDELMESIATSDAADSWLILSTHPNFPGTWQVNCLDPGYFLDFSDLISRYQALAPARLDAFLARAQERGYEVAFEDDPQHILDAYEGLNQPPPFSLNSELPGTINGFLPYQLQGFNFLKDKSGVAMWSTGTGKTVLAAALLKHHINMGSFDYGFVVVKAHNKTNTQRTLARLADIDSLILDAPQKRRQEMVVNLLKSPPGTVVITNYEKFRIDLVHLLPMFEKRVLIIWDEMPTKLKSRQTKLYKSVRKLLYKKVDLKTKRPKELRQWMLSATPIENGPEDFFNCVRLLDPSVYGSIKDFRDRYVAGYFFGQPSAWKNLDHMGSKAARITHQVDKQSPDIASQFPTTIEEPFYIDWNKEHDVLYKLIESEAKKKVLERDLFTEEGIFSLLSVLQMMCCAPSMVSESQGEAAKKMQSLFVKALNNENFSKLTQLRELLTETHKGEKVVVFSAFNDALMPALEQSFVDWNVQYVRYNGTPEQKQIAQDYFQKEDYVQVFLSSDQGSDSISLEEASVVIHYDLPWKWSTYVQRQNRIHRVTSTHKKVRFYTLMMADSVEERKWKVLQKKRHYHDAVFKGDISDQSESARMTKDDLLYILG